MDLVHINRKIGAKTCKFVAKHCTGCESEHSVQNKRRLNTRKLYTQGTGCCPVPCVYFSYMNFFSGFALNCRISIDCIFVLDRGNRIICSSLSISRARSRRCRLQSAIRKTYSGSYAFPPADRSGAYLYAADCTPPQSECNHSLLQ